MCAQSAVMTNTVQRRDCDYEEILNTVKKRDMQDMTRAIAPLKQADDAVLLDTSDLSIEEVVDRILEICAEKGC